MEENPTLIFGSGKRSCLSVRGNDRALFLHRLLTQDIKGIPVGQAQPACLLDRQGKIRIAGLAHVRPDEILLELGIERMEPAGALLEKYRISEAVEMAPAPCPEAQEVPEPVRIAAGIPAIGKEITPDVIPNELGPVWLERFVSFTKGCYVGQEIVARIKYRAHPPRLLTGFVLEGDGVPESGSPVLLGPNPVGIVTSACVSPTLQRPIALGFLNFGVNADLFSVQTPRGPQPARSAALPFVR